MLETILILDFGSQYTQLIARKVRELNVYCEIHPFHFIKNKKFNIQNSSGINVFKGNNSQIIEKYPFKIIEIRPLSKRELERTLYVRRYALKPHNYLSYGLVQIYAEKVA